MSQVKIIMVLVVVGALGIGVMYLMSGSGGGGGLLGGLLSPITGLLAPVTGLLQPVTQLAGGILNFGINNNLKMFDATEKLLSGDIGGAATSIPIFGGIIDSIF